MLALDAAEDIFRRALQRPAEGVAHVAEDGLLQVARVPRLYRAAGAQLVKECAFESDEVGDLDDALLLYRFHRAKVLSDPLVHSLRCL